MLRQDLLRVESNSADTSAEFSLERIRASILQGEEHMASDNRARTLSVRKPAEADLPDAVWQIATARGNHS